MMYIERARRKPMKADDDILVDLEADFSVTDPAGNGTSVMETSTTSNSKDSGENRWE